MSDVATRPIRVLLADDHGILRAGLRALLGAMKDARHAGGDFRLAAIRADVQRVLELSGFMSILKTFPDVDSALGSFAG